MRISNQAFLWLSRHLPYHAACEFFASQVRCDWEGSTLYRSRKGLQFELDLRDRQPREIYLFDTYEKNCMRWLRKCLRPGMVFVDAGANLGIYSLTAASCVGQKGEVHAFEPHPENFDRLARNRALNPDLQSIVRINRLGLGQSFETTLLYHSTLSQSGLPSAVRRFEKDETSCEMNVTSLDAYADANGLHAIDLLKIDIEGYEMQALLGAQRLLSQKRPMTVIIELNEETARMAGTSVQEEICFLEKLGFEGFWPRAFPLGMTPIENVPENVMDNALFVKR